MRRAPRVAFVALVCAACTGSAGQGFGAVEVASLEARFDPGGRLGDDGSVLILGGERITVAAMTLEAEVLRLDELSTSGGGSGEVFDPANPPPGYSLCHGGHCHSDDGRLVDYEDIQAELAAGATSSFVPMVSMPIDATIDLLAGETLRLETFEPGRELRQGTISRARVTLGRFGLTGTLTGGAFGDRVVPIEIDLDLGGALSELIPSREVGLDQDHAIFVTADLVLEGSFLDGLDLAAEETDGRIEIRGGEAGEALIATLLAEGFAFAVDVR